jgi:DNA-binding response OmpR family regulator
MTLRAARSASYQVNCGRTTPRAVPSPRASAGRPGVVVARRELLAEVWQQSYGDDQTIDVHLSWLRRKLGETAARPRYLHTLRGVGVKLEPPRLEPPR